MKLRNQSNTFSNKRHLVLVPVAVAIGLGLILQFNWSKNNQQMYQGATSGLERIVCQHCLGTGMTMQDYRKDGATYCPVCYGLGFRFIKRMNENDKFCPACAGMGRLQDMETSKYRTCGRCDGRGLIRVVPTGTTR